MPLGIHRGTARNDCASGDVCVVAAVEAKCQISDLLLEENDRPIGKQWVDDVPQVSNRLDGGHFAMGTPQHVVHLAELDPRRERTLDVTQSVCRQVRHRPGAART
jgi:hypothetical protein